MDLKTTEPFVLTINCRDSKAALQLPFWRFPYNLGVLKEYISDVFRIPLFKIRLYVNKEQFQDDKRTLDFTTESHEWHNNLFEVEFDDLAVGPKLTRFTTHSPDFSEFLSEYHPDELKLSL